jgi:hypothetical protein
MSITSHLDWQVRRGQPGIQRLGQLDGGQLLSWKAPSHPVAAAHVLQVACSILVRCGAVGIREGAGPPGPDAHLTRIVLL